MRLFILIVLSALLFSCSNTSKKNTQEKYSKKHSSYTQKSNYTKYISSIGTLNTYNNNRILETTTAFFIDSNLIASRLSPIINANKASITTWDGKKYNIKGFIAIDRINDFIILVSDSSSINKIPISTEIIKKQTKVVYPTEPRNNILGMRKGTLSEMKNTNGSMRYLLGTNVDPKTHGTPAFLGDSCIGIAYDDIIDYEKQGLIIPSSLIAKSMNNTNLEVRPLNQIKSNTDKATSLANSKIKGILIETSLGNITIKLYNETPQYRDNFIALVTENYFDSLLIHRVIPSFCIQSGAADTKYAKKTDLVGWKGPGYTLPAHIIPDFFHRRGVVGSPRKPDTKNSKRRSDGSQFYIVTGRKYSDIELDEISKETGYKFSSHQRYIYKTIGGAPHIDGTFTIFGEVISGINIADKITNCAINTDYRPLEDIRIKKVRILN